MYILIKGHKILLMSIIFPLGTYNSYGFFLGGTFYSLEKIYFDNFKENY